jgi:hypothetical protein
MVYYDRFDLLADVMMCLVSAGWGAFIAVVLLCP